MTLLLLNLSHCAHFHRANFEFINISFLSSSFSSSTSYFTSTSVCVFLLLLSQIFIDHWHVYHISIEHNRWCCIRMCLWVSLLSYYILFVVGCFFHFIFIHFNSFDFLLLDGVHTDRHTVVLNPALDQNLIGAAKRNTFMSFFGHLSFQRFYSVCACVYHSIVVVFCLHFFGFM